MNRWQRVGAYLLQRLKEPTTWAGLITVAGSFGLNLTAEQQTAIITLGLLLVGAREGANTATNPTLPSAVKGELPEPKEPIVPPK